MKNTQEEALRAKFRGCLWGLQLGDAIGMPVETMTPEQILEATGGRGVEGFSAPIQRRLTEMIDLKSGDTTDDTYFAFMNAWCLARFGAYDTIGFAREYIKALDPSVGCVGMGGTTRAGLEAVARWFATGGKEGRDPRTPALPSTGKSLRRGNGVAMQAAPFGLFFGARRLVGRIGLGELLEAVLRHGFITHPNPRSSIGAFAVATAASVLLEKPVFSVQDGSELLEQVIEEVEYAEKMRLYDYADAFSTCLLPLRDIALRSNLETLRMQVGTGGDVMQSVPFAIGVFLRHPTDLRAGILEAVNAGGDTDTNAAIAGALIGVNVGEMGVPEEWLSFRPGYAQTRFIADRLFEAALNISA